MADTHDFGQRFWYIKKLGYRPTKKKVFKWPTYEIDPPYRFSNSTVVILRFVKRALVYGKWEPSPHEGIVKHLAAPIGAKKTGPGGLGDQLIEPQGGPDSNPWL